jgi:hypothetical protein
VLWKLRQNFSPHCSSATLPLTFLSILIFKKNSAAKIKYIGRLVSYQPGCRGRRIGSEKLKRRRNFFIYLFIFLAGFER